MTSAVMTLLAAVQFQPWLMVWVTDSVGPLLVHTIHANPTTAGGAVGQEKGKAVGPAVGQGIDGSHRFHQYFSESRQAPATTSGDRGAAASQGSWLP